MQDHSPQATAAAFSQFQPESLTRAMADYKLAEEAAKAAAMIRANIIASLKPIIEHLDIKPYELGMSPYTAQSLPPKFRNPNTGETWHGQGRRPSWIPSELKTKDLEQFRIKD